MAVPLAGAAATPSDPSNFVTVLNIGTVAPDGVVLNGPIVGSGDEDGIITADNLFGEVLGADTQLNLYTGGTIDSMDIGPGNNIEVNVFDGFVDDPFIRDARVNVFGGNVDGLFMRDGELNVTGGVFTDNVTALGSTIEYSGGVFQAPFVATVGSILNISGSNFAINGVPLTGLEVGEAFEITQRDMRLTATLADGTEFDERIRPGSIGDFRVPTSSTLTVTLVPAPGVALALGGAGLIANRRRR
ncbi:MAG: hypothetical protein AAGI53_17045 [Planctomycetota bacterium]